ncbi:hypothetical protein EP51_01405 [Rhodococcus opacus]|uniref:Uncharacterized protein n=1 Tax=Rhodococcus opacus TaxID=37919 RepID=A0A076EE67_RHOOP|nr:hypothetical protein EP51_01405 [Rhodococcus opacus]
MPCDGAAAFEHHVVEDDTVVGFGDACAVLHRLGGQPELVVGRPDEFRQNVCLNAVMRQTRPKLSRWHFAAADQGG